MCLCFADVKVVSTMATNGMLQTSLTLSDVNGMTLVFIYFVESNSHAWLNKPQPMSWQIQV